MVGATRPDAFPYLRNVDSWHCFYAAHYAGVQFIQCMVAAADAAAAPFFMVFRFVSRYRFVAPK